MTASTELTSFPFEGQDEPVQFVETVPVKPGVSCDVYKFAGSDLRDLGVVTVEEGISTPLQRVVEGERTIEGHVSGAGVLYIGSEDGSTQAFSFPNEAIAVEVGRGQTMQWRADDDSELVFYEICEPPYEDGRFENLTD